MYEVIKLETGGTRTVDTARGLEIRPLAVKLNAPTSFLLQWGGRQIPFEARLSKREKPHKASLVWMVVRVGSGDTREGPMSYVFASAEEEGLARQYISEGLTAYRVPGMESGMQVHVIFALGWGRAMLEAKKMRKQ